MCGERRNCDIGKHLLFSLHKNKKATRKPFDLFVCKMLS